MSKAFDCVSHRILLSKLPYYGIQGLTLDWFRSYLDGRKQRVITGRDICRWNGVVGGVPQGSVLGPLLFILYLNDVDNITLSPTSYFSIYADDIAVYG